MTILILHGITGHAGTHWQGWLHNELIKKGHAVIMPTLPHPNHPDRYECLATIKELAKNSNLNNLILVGHSLGVVSALDFIEQAAIAVKALVSVGGFAHDYGSKLNSYFMIEKQIDFTKVNKNVKNKSVIYGNDDPHVPQWALSELAKKLHVEPTVIPKGGHLNTESGYTTFPLLRTIIHSLNHGRNR